jgi:hypothetical protein
MPGIGPEIIGGRQTVVGFVTVTQALLSPELASTGPEVGVGPTVAQLVNGGNGAEPRAVAVMLIVLKTWPDVVGPVPL